MSGYVRIRQDTLGCVRIRPHTSAYVKCVWSPAFESGRREDRRFRGIKVLQNLKFVVLKYYTTCIAARGSVYAGVAAAGSLVLCAASSVAVGRRDRGHLLTVIIRQHTSAYVSIREHTSA
jgi:hypothetical protein